MSSANACLQLRRRHCVAAVLDDDDLAVESGQPRQGVDERCSPSPARRRGPELTSSTPSSCGRSRRDRSVVRMVLLAALRAGRPRWSLRGRSRSTRSRGSPAAPARHTSTPLMLTSSRSGSNAAEVVPTAARTRPQFGSLPNNAHLSRLFRAMARPTSTASSSEAAPLTTNGDMLRRALGVIDELAGQVRADGLERRPEVRRLSGYCRTPRWPARSRCRSWRGTRRRRPARTSGAPRRAARVEPVRADGGVGRDHAQHRGESSARACPRLSPCRRPIQPSACTLHRLLGHRVGRANGVRGVRTAVGGQSRRRPRHAGQQSVHREPFADQAGRAHRDLAGPDVECGRDALGGGVGVGEPGRTRCTRWLRRS